MDRLSREEIKDILRAEPYQPGTAFRIDSSTVMIVTQDGHHARIGIIAGNTITWGAQHYIE